MDIQQVHETKSDLQLAWRHQWKKHNKRATLAGATGIGKTKPAIDEMMELYRVRPTCKIFVAVPTTDLRDNGWPDQVKHWYGEEGTLMWNECVHAECYVSMDNVKGQFWDLVILDEVHWITPNSAKFFDTNTYEGIMGMTATAPEYARDPVKYSIIDKYAPVLFSYSLSQGVEDGIVADYRINVIMMPLESTKKTVKAGSKAKPFMTTEKAQYEYIFKQLRQLHILQNVPGIDQEETAKRAMFKTLELNRFINNLQSKTELARKLMAQILPNKRTIIFCGSIQQADTLCGEYVYHSKVKSDYFQKFKEGEGQYIGVVNAANEGHNIVNLDQAIVVQLNSNERHLVQRIGRTVRVREDHTAMIWILCAQGTADETWLEKSMANLDRNKVHYLSSKEFE
jgi:superfamily II DNA or RNA helicase